MSATAPAKPRSAGREALRELLSRPIIAASVFTIIVALVVSIFASVLAPFPVGFSVLQDRLLAPSAAHPFGTDDLGRDVLSQTIYATQTSFAIAITATLICGVFGTLMGVLAGWFGGAVDTVISFLIDVQSSMPAFILALGTLVFFGGSPVALVVVLSIEGWERFARIMRAQVMLTRQSGYVVSAVSLGVSTAAITRRHVLPALIGPLAVQLTLALPIKILIESSLSFLGLGIRPPSTSLGQIVGIGRDYLTNAWWIALFPGLVIVLISVAISLIGDHLQDRMVNRG